MKKLILFAILFTLMVICIQAKDVPVVFPLNEAGKIVFTEVIEMPNITKDALYTRAYEWFAKAFNSANNVIQMQDKENGKIVGKGSFGDINVSVVLGMATVYGNVKFTISIYLKDGKYKYEVTDFYHEGSWVGGGAPPRPYNAGALENEIPECGKSNLTLKKWGKIKEETNKRVLALIESLKKSMIVESAGDNW
jgi:hypothetical protein